MRMMLLASLLMIGALPSSVHADRRETTARADRREATRSVRLAAASERTATERTAIQVVGEPGEAAPRPTPRDELFLTTSDIRARMAPIGPEIERCYFGRTARTAGARRGGQLDLMLVIARQGHVVSLEVAAPALSAAATREVRACLDALAVDLAFPARRNDTTAIVPYYFQKTLAPNAGPLPSCWSASGC